MSGISTALPSLCRKMARVLLVCFLLIPVTGSSGLVLQGIAWWKMAQDRGGISALVSVIFDEAPCDMCRTAQQVSVESKSDPGITFSVERVEVVRLDSGSEVFLFSPQVVDMRRVFPRLKSDQLPHSAGLRPDVPPPRSCAV